MAKKTAVVVIHGIGEQRPMETLPGFVKAVWSDDAKVISEERGTVFSKPDFVSGSFELRRMTTRRADLPHKKRVDFFEFYWAHMMPGHTLSAVAGWLKRLFLRAPSHVPPKFFGLWLFGIVSFVIAALIFGFWYFDDWDLPFGLELPFKLPEWSMPVVAGVVAIVGYYLPSKIVPIIGDAARYLDAAPGNIELRQKIRSEGVELLEALAKRGKYDRIVLVGHSLGSVIAYDIVNFLWTRLESQRAIHRHATGGPAAAALKEVEAKGLVLRDAEAKLKNASTGEEKAKMLALLGDTRVAYREAQRAYFETLSTGNDPLWLISDLVTLGAPLSKADVLLADTPPEFEERKRRRELPTCPPIYEKHDDTGALEFSYETSTGSGVFRPHHAAPFSATVWTNVYVPNRLIILGDVISGPVAPKFGHGITDVELRIGTPPGFRHTDYWRASNPDTADETLEALRRAMNLAEEPRETVIWSDKHLQTPIAARDW